MKTLIFIFSLMLLALQVYAIEQKAELAVEDIIKDGYIQMSGDEIRKQLFGKTIIIKDLHAGSEYEVTLSKNGSSSQLKQTAQTSPAMLTNIEYQSRAPLLSASNALVIKDNKVVSTDGVRTFSSRLYMKDSKMLGARDIDNGRIYLQILLKP